MFLLCPDNLVIMTPYMLMTVPDPFHLGFHPVTSLTQFTDALTPFLYFFQAIHMDILSVSEQEMQSPEAVSRSDLTMFPLDKPGSEDVQSSVLFKLPVTASSSGSAGPLLGLEEGLEDSHLCHMEPVSVSGLNWAYGCCPVWSCANSQPQILWRQCESS